jgi:hypothetical protein
MKNKRNQTHDEQEKRAQNKNSHRSLMKFIHFRKADVMVS